MFDDGLKWDYGGVPLFVSTFWTALTFIDALAVILLFARPRYGLVTTVAIIVSDVAVNTWVGMVYGIDVAAFSAQMVFLLFVLLTVRTVWRTDES